MKRVVSEVPSRQTFSTPPAFAGTSGAAGDHLSAGNADMRANQAADPRGAAGGEDGCFFRADGDDRLDGEFIALPGHRDYQAGVLRVSLDLSAQTNNQHIHAALIRFCIATRQRRAQVVT